MTMTLFTRRLPILVTCFFALCFSATAVPLSATQLCRPDHPFIIAPIPKCGTHLLRRCLELMGKVKFVGLLGETTQRLLDSLDEANREHAILHCYHYTRKFAVCLCDKGYKCIFMYRDPRDACVSLVFYMDQLKGGLKRDFYTVCPEWDHLSFDEKLLTVINGDRCPSYLKEWFLPMSQWMHYPGALKVRFEDLVGAKGGGDEERQRHAIAAIAKYIGVSLSHSKIRRLVKHLYQVCGERQHVNGVAFDHGKIGAWKKFFKEQHKTAFKERYNCLLEELGYERCDCW